MLNIEKSFEFHNGDTIVVGCSTGPDSMALVDMLLRIREKYNLSLIVCHVNHNLREQSKEEEEFIKEYCKEKDILLETMTIEEYGDDNFHNEAHNIRYKFFDTVVKKYNANYLMTAHHGDDLIETVLMKIVRGSNILGYSGFRKVIDMDTYKVVRPLIEFTKDELEEYDKENKVKYYIDASNDKDKYTRNRYRKYILPFLKKEENNVHLKFLKFSNTLQEADNFLVKERNKALKRVVEDNKINIDKFNEEDIYIQKEILYFTLNKFYPDDLILVNDKHINLLFDLINNKKANSFVNLPNEVIAYKSYNMIELKRETEVISSYEVEFDNYVSLPNNHVIKKIEKTSDNSNYICRINSKDITLPLIVRTRRVGDKIKVKNLNGSRKVKDIFIDKKIQLNKRDSWPIVVDSKDNVVWIPGVIKSKFDKNESDDYDIILKYE